MTCEESERQSRLEKIADLAESMSNLISNLLTLARYQGSIEPHCRRPARPEGQFTLAPLPPSLAVLLPGARRA
jgi:hypothetical protein